MTVRVAVRIEGRVQGVWFRDSTRERAESEGVVGWVRNDADGSVQAEFEGSRDAVGRVVEWCRTGPRRAVVTDVHVEDRTPTGDSGFRITR